MKFSIGFLVLIVCAPSISLAQAALTGTVIVIAQTKHYAIIAADSRAGKTNNGVEIRSVDDSYCKIAPLDGNIVFAAAGLLSSEARTWDASKAARIAVSTIPHTLRIDENQSDLILARWAELMIKSFAEFSKSQLSSISRNNEGHIAVAVLAGFDGQGGVWIHAVQINEGPSDLLSYQTYTLRSNDPPTAYYALGKSDVFFEFERDGVSSRSIAERSTWGLRKFKGLMFDRFKARRLVELTIMYEKNRRDVGGPVDEIELTEKGIRWNEVKPGCAGPASALPTP